MQRLSRDVKEAVLAFGIATAAVAVLGLLSRGIPIMAANLGALVAIVFLYLSVVLARRRGLDIVDFGFRAQPVVRGLVIATVFIALVFPLFAVGFVVFYDEVCTPGSSLARLAMPGLCAGYDGWDGAHWPRFGWAIVEMVFIQVVVVALPEELFFRGVLHEMCERGLPPKRRWLGGGVGWALVLSSLLFALGHLAVNFDLRRLSVFFPGLLFGWMRSATGSILAGTIAHAASNLFIHVLQQIFF